MVRKSKMVDAELIEKQEPIDNSEDNTAVKTAFKSLKAKLLAMKNQPGSVFDFSEEIAVLEEYLK